MQGGREHEALPRFAALFQERGQVPHGSQVEDDIHEMRVQEGLVDG